MVQWNCKKGNTLLVPSGPYEGGYHLFALMLDPVVVLGHGPKPVVLLACITSVKNDLPRDESCLLGKGDHPFIEHDSCIDYRFTRLEQAEHVQSRVREGVFIEKEPCTPELIKRILQGALNSRRIRGEYKKIIEAVFSAS